jgi:serine/threonine-protein phosphatase 2A regulatory subunit B
MESSDASGSGQWRFAQCFGDKGEVEDITEGQHRSPSAPFLRPCHFAALSPDSTDQLSSADIISTVEFDHTGDYLATGDKGGRVVLFERNDAVRFAGGLLP